MRVVRVVSVLILLSSLSCVARADRVGDARASRDAVASGRRRFGRRRRSPSERIAIDTTPANVRSIQPGLAIEEGNRWSTTRVTSKISRGSDTSRN